MARRASDIREKILSTVEQQLRRSDGSALTLDSVAREAGCAKGLVNYHFKTKNELLAAAALRLVTLREARWNTALAGPDLESAIRQSWDLILAEVSSGFWNAWTAISASGEQVTVRTVSNSLNTFNRTIASSVHELLSGMGLTSTVSQDELGNLMGAAIHGLALQLALGIPEPQIEGAHVALWTAVLALTERRRRG
jgi:AcrR family transcriptional regulator